MTATARDLLKPLTDTKLPIVYAKGSLRFKKIALDSALASVEVNLESGGGADFIWFDENTTGTATLTIDDESSSAVLPIGPLRGFRDYPCKRIYITAAAQSGKVLNLWYGKGTFLYGAQPAGKGQWYDRNAIAKCFFYYTQAVAPHADTQRWTYTVPAAKKALLEAYALSCLRITAAGALGRSSIYVNYTPNGGGNSTFLNCNMFNNTVGFKDEQQGGFQAVLTAGDVCSSYSGDTSTGGTIDYFSSAKFTEYDA